jgi:hypothetical protein
MIFPEILVMFISGSIILMGFFLLSLGLSFKKAVNSVMNESSMRDTYSSRSSSSTITVEIPEKTEDSM